MANFKDCEKSFGPINILHGRKKDVLTLQEDKISYVLVEKNLLSDAAGGGAITSVPEVLGTQITRIEEYGISNDAASFTSWGEDIYFTDTKRTSVINLKGGASQADALTPISQLGMNGWFRNEFKDKVNYQKIGGYDPYLKEYVLSLTDNKLPTPIDVLECGFTISQDTANGELLFNLEFGNVIGEASFDYNFENGSANVTVSYDGTTVVNEDVSGSGTLTFNKTKINPTFATVTITPEEATYVLISNCTVADPITVIRMVINSPSNEGETIHNNYNWTIDGYTSPTNIDFVLLESDGVSLYDSNTDQPSVGVIPAIGSIVKMQSEKYITDTFYFDPMANSFKYLVSNTLYTESEINTLRPLLVEATPILNPVTGKYESSFVYNNPSGFDYLYLVWDLTNAYSVDLCYDATDRVAACELCGDTPHYAVNLCYDATDELLACDCDAVPECTDRRVVFQICNSNSALDDNFDIYLNDTYIGAVDLSTNAQVGSVFIADTNTAVELGSSDFVCPLSGMVTYHFNPSILLASNVLEMRNTQNNGNGNFGQIGVRNYSISGTTLSSPCVITDLEYSGPSGDSFTFNFNYTQCCAE